MKLRYSVALGRLVFTFGNTISLTRTIVKAVHVMSVIPIRKSQEMRNNEKHTAKAAES